MALSKYQNVEEMEANIDNAAPYIGENGNWFRWNATAKEYQDTGKPARGAKGDKGTKGDTGATPNITVGTITTGEPGTPATVNITGTTPNLVMDMQIPRGADGTGAGDMTQAVYDPNHRRQDIFSTFSNNNLMINSNFEKAVNQRAETSKKTAGFFIDRWFYTGGGSVTIANQGLILDSTGTDYVRVLQPFEAAIPSGKKVTISWSDGDNVYEATGAVSYDSTKPVYLAEASKPGVTQYVRCATENNKFRVEMVCIGLVTIKWIKLEYSSVATPFVPRSYGEELALCQRYSIKVGEFMRIRASYIGGNEIDFPLPIPTTMRIIPTMIGEPIVNTLNATSVSGFTFSLINSTAGYVIVRATKTAHGQTDALLNPNNILLDAEIY